MAQTSKTKRAEKKSGTQKSVKPKNHAKTVLTRAAEKCAQSGGRLTEKRQRVLELLVRANVPLSAYELVDQYNKVNEQAMPPMSAYRILDFLVTEQLVHKLSSENKYVACSHITCDHEHEVSQFLICQKCHQVREISIQRDIINGLSESVQSAGYHLVNSQLELECICDKCMN